MEQISGEQQNIGRRIKMARNLACISRKDFDELGISMHTIQSWELGRNQLTEKAATKLVEIFHNAGVICSTQWLLYGKGKSPSLISTDFVPYPIMDNKVASLFMEESTIQKEIEFFKANNPNAIVIMVSNDTMNPRYVQGDFVGGTQYILSQQINECIGHDCIVETSEGTFFRRLLQRKNGYALSCLNPQTSLEEPVIFTKHILAATPITWHRWKFKKPE